MSYNTSSPRADRASAIKGQLKQWIEEARADLPKEPVEVEIWRVMKQLRREIERSNRIINRLMLKGAA